jgi:hypothetical protein
MGGKMRIMEFDAKRQKDMKAQVRFLYMKKLNVFMNIA